MKGTVLEIDKSGVGWIRPDDGSADYFFHLMVINPESQSFGVGDMVMFERQRGYKGNFAVNVVKHVRDSREKAQTNNRRANHPLLRQKKAPPEIEDRTSHDNVDHDLAIDPSWDPPEVAPQVMTLASGGGFVAGGLLLSRWRARRRCP